MKLGKKYLGIAVLIVLSLVLASCAAKPTPVPPTQVPTQVPTKAPTAVPTAVPQKKVKVLMMTEGPIGVDQYFINAKEGLDKAAKDFPIEAHLVECTGDMANVAEQLRAASREDWNLLVLLTYGFSDTLAEVAPQTPDKFYVCIDCAVQADNVLNIGFRTHENSFLEGYVAGLLTKSKIVGTVGPVDIPFIHRWTDAFAEGAKYANPNVTVLETLWVGSFTDPAKAKELALTLADKGADHINAAAAAGNPGIFEAAKERGFYTYGVDINECPKLPGHVMENNIKRVDIAVYNSIRDFLAGKKTPGFTEVSLQDGGVDLTVFAFPNTDTQCVLQQHPEIIEKVQEVREKIIKGEIKVTDPLNP